MKVLQATIKRDRKSEMQITFNSKDAISLSDMVSINYQNEIRYFKVNSITAEDDSIIICMAENYGYYNKLKYISDIREFIGLDITVINDEDILQQIEQESRYC